MGANKKQKGDTRGRGSYEPRRRLPSTLQAALCHTSQAEPSEHHGVLPPPCSKAGKWVMRSPSASQADSSTTALAGARRSTASTGSSESEPEAHARGEGARSGARQLCGVSWTHLPTAEVAGGSRRGSRNQRPGDGHRRPRKGLPAAWTGGDGAARRSAAALSQPRGQGAGRPRPPGRSARSSPGEQGPHPPGRTAPRGAWPSPSAKSSSMALPSPPWVLSPSRRSGGDGG
mmetsp:Transcript_5585/g.13587  ORF Transcript_5585/g.13587 Transcript_5585/m.13587 type:complete len:231 (+) Transcript_5585:108-800(+)